MGVKGSLAAITGLVLATPVIFVPLGPAQAGPRRVVVVDAAADQAVGERAAALLRERLSELSALDPIPSGDLARALEQPLPDHPRNDIRLDEAQLAVSRARELLARFSYDQALAELSRAEGVVLESAPERRSRLILSQINFLAGRALLDRGDRERAMVAFREVRRLDPAQKELDPALYLDEVVSAFAAAGTPLPATSEVELSTTYDRATVYVDGEPLPAGTRTTTLEPGLHYFTASYPDHRPVGRRLVLEPDTKTELKLRLIPEDSEERARSLRRRLLAAASPDYLNAARAAVTLAGVDAAAIVRSDDGRALAAVFDARSDTLGEWRPVQPDPGDELFAPLLPHPVIEPPQPPIQFPEHPLPPPEPPWYRKRWGKVAIIGGSGVALTVIGLLARSLASGGGENVTNGALCPFGPCP